MLNLKKSTWLLIALMILLPIAGFMIKPGNTSLGLILILFGGPGILLYFFLGTIYSYVSNTKLL